MFKRNIFTDKPSKLETLLDYALAVIIGLVFAALSLAYFNIL